MITKTDDVLEKTILSAMEVAFANARESIIVMDADKHFVIANQAAHETLPDVSNCCRGKEIADGGLLGSIYANVPTWEEDCSFDFCNQNDEMGGWFEVRMKRMEAEAVVSGWIMFIFNATETMTLMSQLENWAFTDVLTGIPNRRYFIEQAGKEFARFHREKHEMCLMILDIDKFKHINDFYGHQAGDEILWQLAALVKETVRPYDLFARFGGEEFTVLITDAALTDGEKVAERIRSRIESAEFEWSGHVISVTISIGMAAIIDAECTLDNAIFHADMKLLEAKESGRNNVKTIQI